MEALKQLENILLIISVLTIVVFVIIIVFYYYNSRKRSNNYLAKKQVELRYFIQKQVDYHGELIGYECLLRQHQADGTWKLPTGLETLPLQRVISLLEDTFKSLPEIPITLSINLEYEQIVSDEFDYFVRWAISNIEPMKLNVEYTTGRNNQNLHKRKFRRHIQNGRHYGMHFSIDNVGSKLTDLSRIEWMLPVTDTLKCSMRSFRKTDPSEWLDLNLQFWNRLTQERHINLVLTGIENAEDEALAKQLKIEIRQGYLFGHPIDPHHDRGEDNGTKKENEK
ncbi:EAL domain-containing protein [Pediococcus cellicola]|uniref:Diguanylate cyclase phosphodiesterase domain 2 containing protein n=1 Tax=Pediococcus cellicola TaxID=319652 RepID=A0A0R2IYY9_9LACO|nr:EAL domain-containing protein [Pediococcus cellicola]KRN66877.1 diguanylate cyclase phosphodiesterase domain 2 containing protein [Pediococcus cellicola]GEL15972.1 diguanylate cyclase [Pediococcus cellicola]